LYLGKSYESSSPFGIGLSVWNEAGSFMSSQIPSYGAYVRYLSKHACHHSSVLGCVQSGKTVFLLDQLYIPDTATLA
jgi:hypothetical protein